jgi:hypothetical protein
MADTTFLVAALGQILGGVTIVTDLGTVSSLIRTPV